MMFRRTRFTAAIGALVLALTVSGCSFGGDATGGNGGGGGSGQALPDEGQNLTFVPGYGWAGSDISKSPLEIGINMAISQVLQPLVKFDADRTLQPNLASSWKWVTPTQLEFTLRTDVKFSDGTPFTAADVKGSVERYIAAKAALAAVLAPITAVEAPNDSTVRITTSAPSGTLVGVFSMIYIGKAQFSHTQMSAQDDEYWAKPIGTGPFVLSEYVPNDHFTFTRNDSYWGEKAKLKTLTMKQITDVNAKVTALSNNQAQVIGDVPYDQFETVRALPGVTLEQVDSLSYYFVWFMNDRSPLDKVEVRRAMWMALDLPTIVSSLYGDSRTPMKSFCPSTAFGCVAADGLPTYDPEGAKKLLADAGYADGFTVDVIFSLANATDASLAQALISAWKNIGVTVEPRGLDSATWLKEFGAKTWDMDFQPNQTATGDADYTLNRLYSCAAARLGYCNEDLDTLLTQAQQSADETERSGLYQKAVDIMAKDAPAIPLFETKINAAHKNTVTGLEIPPTGYIDFSTVSLTG